MHIQQEKFTLPKAESWQMFNAISSKYDPLNHLLSLGLDYGWRRSLTIWLPNRRKLKLLDLATGTGDVLITLLKRSSDIESACGIDLADAMLKIAQQKVQTAHLTEKISLQHGDAGQIPYPSENFDVVTMAFGIRNIPVPEKVLSEIFRVLKKNGRVVILEFSLAPNRIFRSLQLFYLRHIVPAIGAMISGNFQAYRYLNQTIEKFPYGEAFCNLLETAGFQIVSAQPLTFGIATIYKGDKI